MIAWPAQLAVLLEGGKFDEANSISGAMLNEFERKDWGEEKIWSGEGEEKDRPPARKLRFWSSPSAGGREY